MLEGRHHQVTHVLAGAAARCGKEAHGVPIAADDGKGNPDLLALSQPISKPLPPSPPKDGFR
jgi:hypothetical protein